MRESAWRRPVHPRITAGGAGGLCPVQARSLVLSSDQRCRLCPRWCVGRATAVPRRPVAGGSTCGRCRLRPSACLAIRAPSQGRCREQQEGLVPYGRRPRHGRRLRQGGPGCRPAVVATGRNSDAVSKALGQSNDLLPSSWMSRAAPMPRRRSCRCRPVRPHRRAGEQCGQFLRRLLRGANAGAFERQLSVSLIGPMNVTRAVLPVMRKQRAGHIISISSSAGLAAGFDSQRYPRGSSASRAGWSRCTPRSHRSPSPLLSSTPGSSARTLTEQSTNYAEPSIADYTSAAGRWSSIGNPRTVGNTAIPRNSPEHSSRLPARSLRRAGSSLAPMRLQLLSGGSPISSRRLIAYPDLSTSLAFDDDQAGHPNAFELAAPNRELPPRQQRVRESQVNGYPRPAQVGLIRRRLVAVAVLPGRCTLR